MKFIKILTILVLVSFSTSVFSSKDAVLEYITLSKVAGSCNFMERIKLFEQRTNTEKNLYTKLFNYEMARLNKNENSWNLACDNANAFFIRNTKALEDVDEEDDLRSVYNMMLTSSLNGYCGMMGIALDVLNTDDKSANLLVRFLSSEAVRFGHSTPEYFIKSCSKASELMKKTYETLDL